ncbi:MAG: hypothetical protein R8L07_06460 [Alphaproteobacteria bacterium]|nr:hypothetical protein [Alphaproteobacteria bacterium]
MRTDLSPILRRAVFAALAVATLGACTLNTQKPSDEGIGFRTQRFEDIAAMREYRTCVADAVELDRQAYATRATAKYLASARLLESCEAQLGPSAANVAPDERMQAYGLAVQNYIKGGDVDKAREALARFETAFAGQDLYYADGSSFTDTMGALLGRYDGTDFGQFSTLNVNADLKAEMRRVAYWSKN